MKIRLLSDLHLESSGFEYTYQGEDVLVLVGDIIDGNNIHRLEYWLETIPDSVSVAYVPGNHEFYHTSLEAGMDRLIELTFKRKSLCVLQNDWNLKVHEGIKYYFFGGTQFSHIPDELAGHRDFKLLGDFRYTHNHSIEKHNEQFELFNEAYDDFIKLDKYQPSKIIVISHFLPSAQCIHPKHKSNSLNTYYCADNEERVKQADLWLFGHTHSSVDIVIDKTRVVCNPRGYSKFYNLHPENPDFNPNLIIEI